VTGGTSAHAGRPDEPSGQFWSLDGGPHVLERTRERAGSGLWILRGRRCTDVPAMFGEYARQLRFPDYFGRNWAALEDCLTDLAWLPAPGYVVLLDGAESLLVDERPAELVRFVDLLDRVGRFWATPVEEGEAWDRPSVGFHTVLATSTEGRRRALAGRLRTAQASVRS
jgi:RNAse (barnase) inhibitor barstar